MGNRNYRVDNIRAIAMLCIILAHCGAPLIINNFRSFDVITLVFLSSFVVNINKLCDCTQYKKEILKRSKRIFVPTFMFIILMSLLQFIVYMSVGRSDLFTINNFINSLLLCENSVGYVWIMKVYFMNFVLILLLGPIIKKIKYIWQYIFLILVFILLYFGCLNLYYNEPSHSYLSWILINEWFLCCFFYLIVGIDAIYFKLHENWKKYGLYFWMILLLITLFFYHQYFWFAPTLDKRPAGLQYLAYGMTITYLLFKVVPNKKLEFFNYISINSMEIYYSHTFIIFFTSCFQNIIGINSKFLWILQFFIAFAGSICISKYLKAINNKILNFGFK